MTYRVVSLAASVVCLLLCLILLLLPDVIYWLFNITGAEVSDFLARRAAMLFLGFAVLCFLGRNAEDSEMRRTVSVAMAIAMAGLAATGIFEFMRGYVGIGIWLAIVVEVAFAVLFGRFWVLGRR
ncbi:MAG: hypothetical protein JKY31_00455 [Rhodobacteraceae bacterium]|nr:hypothetical protein [Paracoccaceae bacterium]